MLKIFGLGASQPCRAVWWACLIKDLPFKLCHVGMNHFGAGGPLAHLNPIGQVPVIDDDGYLLCEMPAILTFLCRKHNWTDLYPADLRAAGLIDQYLHFHHNGTRRLTRVLMAPHVCVPLVDLAVDPAEGSAAGSVFDSEFIAMVKNPNKLELGQQAARAILGQLEKAYFRNTDFLCTGSPSIADIACYQEVAQLKWANLFDFEQYPKVENWLREMKKLPFHDTAHRYNIELGDIATKPNTMERFIRSDEAAASVLVQEGITVEQFK